ncbi:SMC-Scp complex subunit ScpB [Nanoarchaeota archaeon]|nr:MAG: SMC-Scp complex subunit ScpB [Nanoarchaeota archaeon]
MKSKIEALLFATNTGFTTEEIAKRVGITIKDAKKAIEELKKELKERGSSIEIINENGRWRMTIKSYLVPLVRDLLPMDMPKSKLKTLAVIVFKSPVKQSEVVAIRGNKAYEHIRELEKEGFVSSKKYGRTRMLNITRKFFEKFDVDKDVLRRFKLHEQKQ